MSDKPFPMAHFGSVGNALPRWRGTEDTDPDDEQLPETPSDVVGMLGFDPAETEEN